VDSVARLVEIGAAVPATARIWNRRLGGKQVGDQFAQLYRGIFHEAPFDPPKNLTNLGGVARKPLSTSPAGSVHESV
jgi:hypothetical protein